MLLLLYRLTFYREFSMQDAYKNVTTRFLRQDERLILSEENEMPLVIEAKEDKSLKFLQTFLETHSTQLVHDLSKYGAVLFRGFDIKTESDFENTILSIKGFRGISDALMSEHGRTHVGDLKYVLHTNSVYKTGGTLYLGGFHTENYYSADVPGYISFCCLKPSDLGGETGLVNMEKVYQGLDDELKKRLEKNTFFVSKWLVSEVAERYQIPVEQIEKICKHFDLPISGNGEYKYILMYKPSIFEHPLTKNKALGINLFEIPTLNPEMRKCFMDAYQGDTWFWHRFVWRLPSFVFKILETVYMSFASFFKSPKESLKLFKNKLNAYKADKKTKLDFIQSSESGKLLQ